MDDSLARDVEEWFKEQERKDKLIWCETLKCKITLDGCVGRQKRGGTVVSDKNETYGTGLPRTAYISCKTNKCDHWQGFTREKGKLKEEKQPLHFTQSSAEQFEKFRDEYRAKSNMSDWLLNHPPVLLSDIMS